MKCVIKRPKLIIKNKPLEKSYFVIYFSQNHFKNSKKKYSLFKINIGLIESCSKTYFSDNNICPFYRRNNIVIGFVESKNFNIKNTQFFFLDHEDNYSNKNLNSHINKTLSNEFFSLKVKHLVKGFFQNHYNQSHHHHH